MPVSCIFDQTLIFLTEKRRDSLTTEAPKRQQLSDKTSSDVRLSQNTAMNMLSSGTISPSPPVSYSLAHMGAGGTAIAAAASQAIAATQQVPLSQVPHFK